MNQYVDQDLAEELQAISGWQYDWWTGAYSTYSLGYLLDTLGTALRSLTQHSSGKWSAKVGFAYKELPSKRGWIIGGHTAPNAAARLAIKLFKQGKLIKEA